jgi:hypothetical protein
MTKKKLPPLAKRKADVGSKYWRTKADRLWSKTIRRKWGFKCAICGSTEGLQAHHLIAKKAGGCLLRHDLNCGVCLCSRHHGKWGAYDSAHSGHLSFAIWLSDNHPSMWKWIKTNITKIKTKSPYPKMNYKKAYEVLTETAHKNDLKGN